MTNQITWKTNSAFLQNSDIPPKKIFEKVSKFIKEKHNEAWEKDSNITHEVDVIIRFRKKELK